MSHMLKRHDASIIITYVKDSQLVKVNLQDPNQVKIFFPTPLAEKLGVNPNFHDKPIGNERHAFKYGVDLSSIVRVFRYCKLHSHWRRDCMSFESCAISTNKVRNSLSPRIFKLTLRSRS